MILLKDICNIITAAKQGRSINNLDITVQTLKDKYGMYLLYVMILIYTVFISMYRS